MDNALRDRQALISLGESEGWKVLCARHAELFAELTVEMHDVRKTPKEQAENLRQARSVVEEIFAPNALLTGLLYRVNGVVAAESKKEPTKQFSDTSP